MAVGNADRPFGVDPLIAEARRRERRRRALVVALMVGAALGLFLGLRGTGAKPAGGATQSPVGNSRPQLVFNGSSFSGSQRSMGDRNTLGYGSTIVACRSRRHYIDGFGLQNRSHAAVTLLDVQWQSPSPAIVDRVATQFRVTRPDIQAASYDWNGVSSGPLTVPPGRYVTVESDFLFRHCRQLAGGHSIYVPGAVVIRYRAAGRIRWKALTPPAEAFTLAFSLASRR
jgi:hypothetical protein